MPRSIHQALTDEGAGGSTTTNRGIP